MSLGRQGNLGSRQAPKIGDFDLIFDSIHFYRFEGCIHEVRSSSVLLKFEQGFHNTYGGELYDIEFKMNRGPYRRQHQATEVNNILS